MFRLTTRIAVGVTAVAALVAALGAPASANTVNATITGGSIDLYDSTVTLVDSLALPGTPCAAATGSITTTATTWTASMSLNFAQTVGGVNQRVVATLAGSGTYTGTNVTGTINVTLVARPATGCTVTGGTCTLTDSVTVNGVFTAANPATLVAGDTLTTSGSGGGAGVTGTCGALIAVASMDLTNLVFTV
jgi:hypothetical protein